MKGYVLLSGGIDSSTALGLAVEQHGADTSAISVDYGQRHKREIEHASRLADHYRIQYAVIELPMSKTLLTDPSRPLPAVSYNELPHGISPTYVPFRNGLMLSALASHIQGHLSEDEEARLYFGAHQGDAARDAYPDCTPEFIGAMAAAIYIGTYQRIRLVAPFEHLEKHQIISTGFELGVPYDLTWSCYAGGEKHCGVCPTCRARKEAFELAGVFDPTEYAA